MVLGWEEEGGNGRHLMDAVLDPEIPHPCLPASLEEMVIVTRVLGTKDALKSLICLAWDSERKWGREAKAASVRRARRQQVWCVDLTVSGGHWSLPRPLLEGAWGQMLRASSAEAGGGETREDWLTSAPPPTQVRSEAPACPMPRDNRGDNGTRHYLTTREAMMVTGG